MKLIPVTLGDLALYEAMFGDEEYMKDLGGVQPAEKIPGILQRQARCMSSDKGWVFKIIAESNDWNTETYGPFPNDECSSWDFGSGEKVGDLDSTTIVRGIPVGTVCVWTGYDEKRDVEISEIGWGILVKFQGKGLATLALKLLLEKAKDSGRWGVIHAMTNINNVASNKLCRRVGFSFIEETEMEYDGRMLPANLYTFDSTKKE